MSKHGNFKETFQEQTVDIENLEKQKKKLPRTGFEPVT